ncbi:MAG: hypothetical protein ACM3RP_09370 [Chitinophagales bacterium]
MVQAAKKPVIAVVQSEYTADAYAKMNSNFSAYFGTVEMLLFQENFEYDVVTDKDVEDGKLSSGQYKLAIMVANNAVSDKEAAAVTEFVKAGGALFAGYNVALRNEKGELRKDFAIAEVLGLSMVGTANGQATGNYGLIAPVDQAHPFFAGLPKEIPFDKRYSVLVVAKPEVKVLATYLSDKGKPAGPDAKNGAIFLNGKVVYAGGNIWDPDKSAACPELNKLIANVINTLLK